MSAEKQHIRNVIQDLHHRTVSLLSTESPSLDQRSPASISENELRIITFTFYYMCFLRKTEATSGDHTCVKF